MRTFADSVCSRRASARLVCNSLVVCCLIPAEEYVSACAVRQRAVPGAERGACTSHKGGGALDEDNTRAAGQARLTLKPTAPLSSGAGCRCPLPCSAPESGTAVG